jgi:hypothetical protein
LFFVHRHGSYFAIHGGTIENRHITGQDNHCRQYRGEMAVRPNLPFLSHVSMLNELRSFEEFPEAHEQTTKPAADVHSRLFLLSSLLTPRPGISIN